jgi:hypothetical protein
LHTGVFVVLLTVSSGCGQDTISVDLTCPQPAPVLGIEGTWRGQVSGRELVIALKQECSLLGFQTFWTIVGTWEWGVGSSGTAFFLAQNISLKGNTEFGTFRGLTITLNETPPFGATITGVATGELPATASPSGSWVTISDEFVTLERR